jgi:hypothetical protein
MTNTIFLKGDGIIKEAVAAAAGILPGHRLDLTLNAGVLEVGVGAAAGALDAGRAAFAVENSEIGNEVSVVYADNSQVKYVVGHKGDEVQARAVVALTWATGAPLYAAAGGRVTDVPGTGIQALGYALSDVAGSSADDLVPMEVA